MTNKEIKPVFERIVPKILNGDYSESCELANALLDYTWSYSNLKYIAESNIIFLNNLISPFENTDATVLGKLVHSIVLGTKMPEFVFEKIDGRTKEGKERKKELDNLGLSVWNPEIKEKAEYLAKKLLLDENCKMVIQEAGETEVWRNYAYKGFRIGGYLDKETNLCVEVKTASSCNPDEFSRKSVDMYYPLQAKIYNLVTGGKEVVYPVVSTSGLAETILFEASGDYLDYGQYQLDMCLNRLESLIELLQNEQHIGYGVRKLVLPSYKKYELEQWKKEKEI